ncbi:hypothetical protein KY290_037186 [Solanum tuberosum]|uniref:Uncharacterized protein n=1 Tax=Solanum tuberosum TaxID=4113 RepID=A0ABQ7TWI5_SOLTU|nr:hypothetical protein KY289_036710 [Solanum tuberosum]KAH0738481.1 hypothetical protein KY290_037186 [Solanum tuberosum]
MDNQSFIENNISEDPLGDGAGACVDDGVIGSVGGGEEDDEGARGGVGDGEGEGDDFVGLGTRMSTLWPF